MKVYVTVLVCFVLNATVEPSKINLRILNKEELNKSLSSHQNVSDMQVTTNKEFPKDVYATIPSDNGGSYGDLLHARRENGDVLLIRETIINEFTSSQELDMYWYGNFPARLSHVSALNFGRERGFTLQIATRKNDGYVEVFIRIRPYKIIRMFIEVYGFP